MSDKPDLKPKIEGAATAPREWFVRMSNGSMFGPINTKGLVHWACDGRIMPDDEISPDRINWRASRDLDELGMDTMIERPDGTFMGPFNAKAIDPLAREGKIPPRSKRFHVSELETRIASRPMALFSDEAWDKGKEEPRAVNTAKAVSLVEEDSEGRLRAELEEQIETIRREAKDSIAEYERTIETLEVERDELKTKLAVAAKAASKTSEFSHEFDALAAECAELKLEFAEREAALKKSRASEAVGKARVIELESEMAELNSKRIETEAIQARSKAIASVPKADYDQVVADCAELKAKLDAADVAAVRDREALSRQQEEAELRSQEMQEEYNELLAFSNERDVESKDRIRKLETELQELHGAAKAQGLVPLRRVEEAESRISEIIKERDAIKDVLAEVGANAAIAGHPVEGDIKIIKLFAEGALEMMRKTLEQEKERNTVARAVSAEMQNLIHSEVERLERVLARDPGETSRSEQMEQRSERQISKLQQELESARRHHQADMARAEANERAMEGRCKALIQKETLLREKLSRVEQRTADYDSLTSQLRRKESSLLSAEKEFEGARQQWQIIEATLQHRIDELENGAGLLFDAKGQPRLPESEEPVSSTDSKGFRVEPWMRKMKRS